MKEREGSRDEGGDEERRQKTAKSDSDVQAVNQHPDGEGKVEG